MEARGHVSQTEKAKAYSPCAQVLARPAVRAHPLFQSMQVVPPEQGLEVLSKHIAIKYHYIKQTVRQGTVDVRRVPTTDNRADLLTKAVKPPVFRRLVGRMKGFHNLAKM